MSSFIYAYTDPAYKAMNRFSQKKTSSFLVPCFTALSPVVNELEEFRAGNT